MVDVFNSASVKVLTIDAFPQHSSVATLFQNFAAHGLAGLFNILNAGDDILTGNSFANTLNGGLGRDKVSGGGGNDHLNGGKGIDTIVGGAGHDTISGGAGYDRFIFRAGDGNDRITDFNANSTDFGHHNQDHIVLTQALLDSMTMVESRNATTNAVVGVSLQFADTLHHPVGSIFLMHVGIADISAADFIIG